MTNVHFSNILFRHDSVVINRLRVGHSRITHSYLLRGDDQPTCASYDISSYINVKKNFSV